MRALENPISVNTLEILITIIDKAITPNSLGPKSLASRVEITKDDDCLINAPERSQKKAVLDLECISLFKVHR